MSADREITAILSGIGFMVPVYLLLRWLEKQPSIYFIVVFLIVSFCIGFLLTARIDSGAK